VVIGDNDTVVISASVIPGNEKMIYGVINNLYRLGAEVIYESLEPIHASGHACQDELKMLHSLVKPKFFIPVHGEYRHLKKHARLAESVGTKAHNVLIADIGDTVEQVKANILEACANKDSSFTMFDVSPSTPDYVTAEDIFLSDSQKALWNYVSPDNKNVFCHTLSVGAYYRVSIEYTRIIYGCLTNEVISTSGSIGRHGFVENLADTNPEKYDSYTTDDLSRVPNIAFVIDTLDLTALIPPHITLDEKITLRGCEALGWYRNINGNVYGIVRIHWVYDYDNENGNNMYIQDDMYYLYDSDGNGRIVERDELKSIIIMDSKLMSFKYEPQFKPWV
jgi:hypothetical protein